MSEDEAGEILFPIPENYTLLEWVGSFKCLDTEGDVVLVNVASETLTAWERLGMAQSLYMDAKERMAGSYVCEDDE